MKEDGQIASKTFCYLIEEDVIRTKRIHTLDSDRWECWLGRRRPLDSSGRSWISSMFRLSNFWLIPFMFHYSFPHPRTSFLKEFRSIYFLKRETKEIEWNLREKNEFFSFFNLSKISIYGSNNFWIRIKLDSKLVNGRVFLSFNLKEELWVFTILELRNASCNRRKID